MDIKSGFSWSDLPRLARSVCNGAVVLELCKLGRRGGEKAEGGVEGGGKAKERGEAGRGERGGEKEAAEGRKSERGRRKRKRWRKDGDGGVRERRWRGGGAAKRQRRERVVQVVRCSGWRCRGRRVRGPGVGGQVGEEEREVLCVSGCGVEVCADDVPNSQHAFDDVGFGPWLQAAARDAV